MAINTQKLLPSAKGSPLLKIKASKVVPAVSIKKKAIDIQKLMGPTKEEDPKSIQKTLVNIDSSLKLILKEDQDEQSKKKKEKEKADFEREEKKLEAPKEAKKFNLPTLSVPGASFLDRIKRFLFFTALGFLFTKFQDQLPKLIGIVKVIGGVYGVAENIFKTLLSGLVNFIDRGYQAYDKVRDLAKSIGGEKAQQDFDKLSGKLNEYINYVLIGGIALTGAINSFNKAAGISTKNAAKEAAKKTTGEVAKRAVKKGIIQKTAQAARIGTRKATQAVIGKQATRQLLRLAKGPLSRLPVLGGLIEFGLSWALGDPVGKAAFRGVGTLLLGAVGSLILPGFGTFIGSVAGAELAGKLYEVLFENKKPQGKVQKKQGGGSVTRGGKPQGSPTRSLRITKRKPSKIKPQESQPGKNVGGKKKIKELYPDPSARVYIEGEQKSPWYDLLPPIPKLKEDATEDEKKEYQKKVDERNQKISKLPNPYKALTNTAKILKDIPFGIGALMGGAVDIALGQKLPQNAIKGLSSGISYLISSFANQQVAKSISGIQKEVAALQTGGITPKLRDFSKDKRDEFGDGINNALNDLIQQKVEKAIKEVQKQMMPGRFIGGKKEDTGGEGEGGGGGTSGSEGIPSGDAGDFSGNTKANKAFNYFKSQGYTDFQAAAIVGNLLQENRAMDPTLTNSIGMKGIAQWDGNRWSNLEKFARKKGLNPTDFETQLQFIQEELRTGDGGLSSKTFKSTKNLEEATILFRKQYERPGEAEANDEARIKYARSVLSGSTGTKPGTTTTPISPIFQQKPSTPTAPAAPPSSKPSTSTTQISPIFQQKPKPSTPTTQISPIFQQKPSTSSKKPTAPPAPYPALSNKYGPYEKNETGTKLAGDLGDFMKSWGGVTGSIHQHSRHGGQGTRSYPSYHNVDRAIDLGAYGPNHPSSGGRDEQAPIIKKLIEWNASKGITPVQVIHGSPAYKNYGTYESSPNAVHSNHVHVAYQGGGYIPKQSPKNRTASLSRYPSYSGGEMMIAIQPIIVEKVTPVSTGRGGGVLAFPGVNNTMMSNLPSLTQG